MGNFWWDVKSPAQERANATNAAKTGVHVLSLPSFTWFQADDASAPPRFEHTCEVAGRRQMLSLGGANPTFPNSLAHPDVWPYSIGVFDMVDLRWKDAYDADAPAYVTPAVIQQWVREHG